MGRAHKKMPRERWWAWKERVSHYKALGQLYEAQGLSHVRDLSAEIEVLLGEEAEEKAAEEAGPAAGMEEGGDRLPFRRSGQ